MKDYFKVLICIVIFIIVISALGWILRPASMYAERVAIKTSHQYKEGMEQRAAILQANITQLNNKLIMEGDPAISSQIQSQIDVLNVQLNAITVNR